MCEEKKNGRPANAEAAVRPGPGEFEERYFVTVTVTSS
jgi:hypothetical protein